MASFSWAVIRVARRRLSHSKSPCRCFGCGFIFAKVKAPKYVSLVSPFTFKAHAVFLFHNFVNCKSRFRPHGFEGSFCCLRVGVEVGLLLQKAVHHGVLRCSLASTIFFSCRGEGNAHLIEGAKCETQCSGRRYLPSFRPHGSRRRFRLAAPPFLRWRQESDWDGAHKPCINESVGPLRSTTGCSDPTNSPPSSETPMLFPA